MVKYSVKCCVQAKTHFLSPKPAYARSGCVSDMVPYAQRHWSHWYYESWSPTSLVGIFEWALLIFTILVSIHFWFCFKLTTSINPAKSQMWNSTYCMYSIISDLTCIHDCNSPNETSAFTHFNTKKGPNFCPPH